MVKSFCAGVSASTTHTWTRLSTAEADDVCVMTRKNEDDPGRPKGTVLTVATSFRLPVPHKRVFDFLRDKNSRNQWDILCNGDVKEMAHIANGSDTGNCVLLLRINSTESNMLVVQESCTDSTASYVIYAPAGIVAVDALLSGSNPDYDAMLPSGFAILPDPETEGSVVTVAFQILLDSVPTATLSIRAVAPPLSQWSV